MKINLGIYGFIIKLFLVVLVQPVIAENTETLNLAKTIEINSPTTGIVTYVAKLGKHYKKSELLVEFDNHIIKSQIKALQLQLQLQQKIIAEAKREFGRSNELYEGTMLSDHELKLAEIDLLKEQSYAQRIKSQLVEKRWILKHHQVKAPFDGYIVELFVFPNYYIVNHFNAKPLLKFRASKQVNTDALSSKD